MAGLRELKTGLLTLVLLCALLTAGCAPAQPPPSQTAASLIQTTPPLQLYFTGAGEDPAPVLAGLYNTATDNINIAVYSLTHPDIVRAIGDASKRGAKVRLITDCDQSRGNVQKHVINDLLTIGVPVKINLERGLMHIKMSIIDGKTAALGSYNYTLSASRDNDEVLIVVTRPEAVRRCQAEFERMWNSNHFGPAQMSY